MVTIVPNSALVSMELVTVLTARARAMLVTVVTYVIDLVVEVGTARDAAKNACAEMRPCAIT